jgi:hypothetical protein
LWFDGENFWTAESKDGLGQIFKFNPRDHIVSQWTEPAFSGWAACVVPGFATSIESLAAAGDQDFRLEPIFPNPVRTSARIRFTLPRPAHAKLSIHDATGRRVSTLFSAPLQAGAVELPWKTGALASGVYFWRLEADGEVASRKVVVSK